MNVGVKTRRRRSSPGSSSPSGQVSQRANEVADRERKVVKDRTVSIIITNYNYAQFVAQAIESALDQTHHPTEVVVVDDGSTDESASIIAAYERHVVAIFKPNGGQASAFNAGFAASRGDIVLFLDADDALMPNAVEEVVAAAAEGVAKVQFRLRCCDAELQPLGWTKPRGSSRMASGDLSKIILRDGGYVSPPTSGNAFTRSCLTLVMPVPEDTFRLCADAYLILLSPLCGEVRSIDRELGKYRVHTASNWSAGRIDGRRLIDMVVLDLQKEAHLLEYATKLGHVSHGQPMTNNAAHLAARLASLRVNVGEHPVRSDDRRNLLRRGLLATWRSSTTAFWQKAKYTLWFLAVAAAPRNVASRMVSRLLAPPGQR
jgi:CTP:molybdopterin cytidylyltransferase MocA